jgi:REP element-mobilizing transposase RayT
LTIEHRAHGWLSDTLHRRWQFVLLHTCARHRLACPAYVLMPDHMHLLWLGLTDTSDQRLAIEFLRKHLRPALAPADWQSQAHDHALRAGERERKAFDHAAHYILENPVRAGLVEKFTDYPFLGACIAGYPDLEVRHADYWELFWRIYHRLVEAPKV